MKLAIQIDGAPGTKFGADDHVADMDGMRQGGVLGQFFQRGFRIVVIHSFIIRV